MSDESHTFAASLKFMKYPRHVFESQDISRYQLFDVHIVQPTCFMYVIVLLLAGDLLLDCGHLYGGGSKSLFPTAYAMKMNSHVACISY